MQGNCIICGHAAARSVFSYDAPDVYESAVGVDTRGYARAWVRCENCGFHFSRFSRDPDSLDRIYDTDYRSAKNGLRSADAETLFKRILMLPPQESEARQRVAMIRDTIERLQNESLISPWRERSLRLLDIGGASGVFAYLFHGDSWRAEIVDPGEQGRFIEKFGVTYHQARFDEKFDGGRYHLITMNYVLEHVKDPCAMLGDVRRCLLDQGLLYIEVPDELAFTHKPQDDDIFNSCHLWMFGPSSLQTLLGRAGYEPVLLTRGKSPRGHLYLGVLAWAR